MTPELLSAIAASLSFLATCAAAWAAWKGPLKAAELAEKMRVTTQDREEKRKLRLFVFLNIMQSRATIWNPDCVRALNSIDMIFNDVPDVRRAWARLLDSYDRNKQASYNEQKNLMRDLLEKMALSIGLNGKLGDADFDRIYYPTALQEVDLAQEYQRKEIIKNLGPNQPSANTAGPIGIFPPRPS